MCSPMYSYVIIPLESSQNEKCFSPKLHGKSKHLLYVRTVLSENRVICEIMWKNMVDPVSPHMTT